MNARQAAEALRSAGARVDWTAAEPKIRMQAGALTDELRAAIAERKAAVLIELDLPGALADMQRRMIAKLDAGDHEGGEAIREQMTRLILERSCVRCPGVALAPGDKILCAECRGEVDARERKEATAA